ncbi:hypothetical protein lbkm_2327 [Lachnospiraceae bacterium KM106-2]|nr:hypothetical protein lbkm_2327 [Lachnospiraceae bacterium KM106-2]
MFMRDDNTFYEMREGSAMQWLEELIKDGDMVNKAGAKVTKGYIESLNKKVKELEEKNAMKDEFLKRMKRKVMEK